MCAADPFDLERFVTAQAATYERAERELQAGRKTSHWMWFVFPQLAGLGRSPMARRYAIGSLDEARAYLAHSLLGSRLIASTEAVLAAHGRSLAEIFGSPDDRKFRSSMTLFAVASDARHAAFEDALVRLCEGTMDECTLALLEGSART
jgi:uncharacterized protein (DUF1810 family)